MFPVLLFFLFVLSITDTSADSLAQRYFRRIIRTSGPPVSTYANLQEGTLAGPLAFTANDLQRIYVDSKRLEGAPNTLWNVLRHEYAHTQGHTHNDGSVEMRYSAKEDSSGNIINDDFRM